MGNNKSKFKQIIKFITTIISWTIFVILILCGIFLIYYFTATKVYEKKGEGYEPAISLFTIISASMVPNINVYDVVIDAKVTNPEDIKINDIISFNSDSFKTGQTISVTHRVKEILVDENGSYSFSTKGDNNFIKDPEPVPFSSITGKVILKIPQLGRVQFFLASKAGWLLVVVIPALYIIIKDILKVLKLVGKNEKFKNSKLFFPIKTKKLYLPFHGYKDQDGNKEKFTLKTLIPFTLEEPVEIKKQSINNESPNLNDIYEDLKKISNKK